MRSATTALRNDNLGECTKSCQTPKCGDGHVQGDEECDLGPQNANTGACTNFCTLAVCGDGFIQEGEQCDDGEANDADKNGGCHPETCQVVTTCGDGVVQEDEECDKSAEGDYAAVCTDQCLISRKVIFASSKIYTSMFESVNQSDSECQKMAKAADLPKWEGFVAWLSFPGNSIASRMPQLPYKYVRTDGAPVAESWEDLVDGQIGSPIHKDEAGEDASKLSTVAWTGTLADAGEAVDTCNGWTSTNPAVLGRVGSLVATDGTWTDSKSTTCFAKVHIYCIEK